MPTPYFVGSNEVSQFVQNQILPHHTFSYSSRGLFLDGTGTVYYLQDFADQLMEVMPFVPIHSAILQSPMNTDATNDLFLNTSSTLAPMALDYKPIGLNLATKTNPMNSIAALLQISASSLGTEVSPQLVDEFSHGLQILLMRFLSVALIYGGYSSGTWKYFEDTIAGINGWDQSVAFQGFVQRTNVGTKTAGPRWGDPSDDDGFRFNLYDNLSLSALDEFLYEFVGTNNGHVDYLVMNSRMKYNYLKLWRADGQTPEHITDPKTGRTCLSHNGIPILINDYIMTKEPGPTGFTYIISPDNPENTDISTSNPQTSIYAVVLGPENQGLFGIYPASFRGNPIKIERETTSPSRDAIILKGMIEAGLASYSNTAVARLAGIYVI